VPSIGIAGFQRPEHIAISEGMEVGGARRNDLAAKFAKLFNRVEHVERVDGAGVLAPLAQTTWGDSRKEVHRLGAPFLGRCDILRYT